MINYDCLYLLYSLEPNTVWFKTILCICTDLSSLIVQYPVMRGSLFRLTFNMSKSWFLSTSLMYFLALVNKEAEGYEEEDMRRNKISNSNIEQCRQGKYEDLVLIYLNFIPLSIFSSLSASIIANRVVCSYSNV